MGAKVINPTVQTQMLVRRPIEEVFNSFVDPAVTTRFWFTGSSGKLEPGAKGHLGVGDVRSLRRKSTSRRSSRPPESSSNGTNPRRQSSGASLFTERYATLVQISNGGFQGTEEDGRRHGARLHGRFLSRARRAQGLAGARHRPGTWWRIEPRNTTFPFDVTDFH